MRKICSIKSKLLLDERKNLVWEVKINSKATYQSHGNQNQIGTADIEFGQMDDISILIFAFVY